MIDPGDDAEEVPTPLQRLRRRLDVMGREKEAEVGGARRSPESVVVDIGGIIGALVVNTPQALDGAEIEICPVGTTSRTHTVVRAREVPGGGIVYAGVFPAIAEGDYTLLPVGSLPSATVHIHRRGTVTQFNG